MIKEYFRIKVKKGKMEMPEKITSRIRSQRRLFQKNKKGAKSKEVVIGTIYDEKVIYIPVKRELDVESMLALYKRAADGIVLDKLKDVYYADIGIGLFLYDNEIYFKSQCGFGYTATNVTTGIKLKDTLPDGIDINNIKVTKLSI